ncbi:hypothetical protein TPHA_0K01380 [Tetrapisispora phaffii CBS 4417]|uniref:AB hydrolase-1 domain-containing protein n=1 Tax=Tetrapisispora phaffii (strain ATCC 24235 / CBS 4417 / NBRC 1672 / NRRL Y-8282 / UCD 70-5) TaxID=1071381 RepID=G8BZE3_TETPH|nr:hypothetical protein TPHA_0K01380 [Tetrapisispora phaffii CBS 4417]CCE65271.1 hypothetical protein TPHA_0K01380 [Tetrapisispora phaffii CBS 4417]
MLIARRSFTIFHSLKQKLPVKDIVKLSFAKVSPTSNVNSSNNETTQAFVNIHGLLGNRLIFNSISKTLANTFNADVYSIDLRNHGQSERAFPYDNLTLSNDVCSFVEKHIGLKKPVNLIGFSAGGKVAMLTALNKNLKFNLNKMIIIDISPNYTDELVQILIDNYNLIMQILNKEILIEKNSKNWKQKVTKLFNDIKSSDPSTSLYFSSGFTHYAKNNEVDHENNYIEYNIPLESMPGIVQSAKDWPILTQNPNLNETSSVPTCFFKALKSPIMTNDYTSIKNVFPNLSVVEFNCCHNLFLDAPKECLDYIIKYVKTE